MYLFNFVKSVYFNFRYLPLKQAVYLPIWITTNFKVMKLSRGQIVLDYPYRKNFFLGDCGSLGLQQFTGGLYLEKDSKLILHAMCVIGQGTVLRCEKGATIELGKNFYCNKNCFFRSASSIIFGNDCLLGWNVQINTNNGHTIMHDGRISVREKVVAIGNNVWITSNSIVSKGVKIADGCVVAQGAVVVNSVESDGCIVGGVPAKPIIYDIKWSK